MNSPDPVTIIRVTMHLFQGIAALAGVRALYHDFPEASKVLARVCIAIFLVELIAYYIGYTIETETNDDGWTNNYVVYNLFFPVLFVLLAQMYQKVLLSPVMNRMIQVFYFVFIIFAILNPLYLDQSFNESVQTRTYVFGGCFIVILSGAYFWQLFTSMDKEEFTRDQFFWVSIACAMYFGVGTAFFGMYNHFLSNETLYAFKNFYLTYVARSFSIIFSIFLTISFLCKTGYQKKLS